MQHVGEDRQQGDRAAEQDGEEVHREGAEHHALAEHEIDALAEAREDRLGMPGLQGLRRPEREGQAERGRETQRHRRIGDVFRMRQAVALTEPDHQAGQTRTEHAGEFEQRVTPADAARDELARQDLRDEGLAGGGEEAAREAAEDDDAVDDRQLRPASGQELRNEK